MKKVVTASIIAIFVLLGTIAYASIPGSDGVIHGCYKTSNPGQGVLITVDSETNCPSGYAALNWNQTGPQGPSGISGYEVVHYNSPQLTSDVFSTRLSCPSGKVALGWSAFARQDDSGHQTGIVTFSALSLDGEAFTNSAANAIDIIIEGDLTTHPSSAHIALTCALI